MEQKFSHQVHRQGVHRFRVSLLDKLTRSNPNSFEFDFVLEHDRSNEKQYILGPEAKVEVPKYEYQIIWLLKRAGKSTITIDEINHFMYFEHGLEFPDDAIIYKYLSLLRNRLKEAGSIYTPINRHRYGWTLSTE